MYYRSALTSILIVALTPLISAQTPSKPPSSDSRQLQIRTICAKYNGKDRNISISQGDKNEAISLPLYDDAFSETTNYNGPARLQVSLQGAPQAFTSITLPPVLKEVILLFIPVSKTASKFPYRIIAMDGSNKKFSYGERRMINLASVPIAIKYGKKLKKIPMGSTHDILISKSDVPSKRFPIEFFKQKSKGWFRFSATRWTIDPDKRSLVIFYKSPNSESPTYRSIAEYRVNEDQVQLAYEKGAQPDTETNKTTSGKVPDPAAGNKGKTTPPIPLKQ